MKRSNTVYFILTSPAEPTRQPHKWIHMQTNMESWRILTNGTKTFFYFSKEFLRKWKKKKNMVTTKNISIFMFITDETLHRGSCRVQVRISSHLMRTFSYFSNIYGFYYKYLILNATAHSRYHIKWYFYDVFKLHFPTLRTFASAVNLPSDTRLHHLRNVED